MIESLKQFWVGLGKDVPQLHREATERQQNGDWNGAIRRLRAANRKAKSDPRVYSLSRYLRLPLFLQKAGYFEEAWYEYHRLLIFGYPNQLSEAGVRWKERAVIYDEMRLALQREERYNEAAIYGALAHVAGAYSTHLMTRDDYAERMEPYRSGEACRDAAARLLHDTDDIMPVDELAALLRQAVCRFEEAEIDHVLENVQHHIEACITEYVDQLYGDELRQILGQEGRL